jgi:hypothetical protein
MNRASGMSFDRGEIPNFDEAVVYLGKELGLS